jgi:hypothetical protein
MNGSHLRMLDNDGNNLRPLSDAGSDDDDVFFTSVCPPCRTDVTLLVSVPAGVVLDCSVTTLAYVGSPSRTTFVFDVFDDFSDTTVAAEPSSRRCSAGLLLGFHVGLCRPDDGDLVGEPPSCRRVSPSHVCTATPVSSADSRAFLSALRDSRFDSFFSKSASKLNSTDSAADASASDESAEAAAAAALAAFRPLSGTAFVVFAFSS